MRTRRLALLLGAATLALAACGDDSDPVTEGPTTTSGSTATPVSTPATMPADRGWLTNEPDWEAASGGAASDGAGADDMAMAETASREPIAPAPGDIAAPEPGEGTAGPLRAGSVDDNSDFAGYLDYLTRVNELGIGLRNFDPTGRIVVRVTGSDGLPVAGAEVRVATANAGEGADPAVLATLRTSADGSARFHPALYDVAELAPFEFVVTGADGTVVSASADLGGDAALVLGQAGGRAAPIALDVLFLLDATGSMGDEIDRLKTQIDSVAERVAALEGTPDVRFGMTLYRDEGDQFVTATRDFTSDVAAFRADLADVVADGGGDYPEALEEGLAEALTAPTWRDPASTLQLVFLVADAPPQIGRQVAQPYDASLRDAIGRGIKIFPVASSESDDQAEAVFRQLAQATGARFVFLSYGAGGAATGENTDIAATDYEELALDDLVVRLVGEELAALTGNPAVVPPVTPSTAPPTNPPGQ
jgi:hypothetical protein